MNREFAESMHLSFPLVSDPSTKVAGDYGVLSGQGPFALRSYFLIDQDGTIAWMAVNKGILPIQTVLESIKAAREK